MRRRTAAVLLVVLAALAGGSAYALVWADSGGSLDAVWVSDTPRNTSVNHHGVGANAGMVVAPMAEQGSQAAMSRYSCSLVRLDAGNGSTRWRWAVPPERCFLHALTRPAVADLDGDGSQEVLAGTIENATVVLDATTGREAFAVPMTTYGYAQPTVADLLGDGDPEIVASDIGGGVVVASADGTVLWRANVSRAVWDSPVVADVDNDGDGDGDGGREVVVGGSEETVAFAANGTVLWRRPTGGNEVGVARTDRGVSVVSAGFDGVAAFDGATGSRLWNRTGFGSPSMGALADGDGDGAPEIYLSTDGNVVAALDATDGSEEWRTRLAAEETTVTPAVLADLTGDGTRHLVVATSGGTVSVLDPADGSELAAYERDVPVWTAVTPANLTADPGAELLVRYGDGRVVALGYES